MYFLVISNYFYCFLLFCHIETHEEGMNIVQAPKTASCAVILVAAIVLRSTTLYMGQHIMVGASYGLKLTGEYIFPRVCPIGH